MLCLTPALRFVKHVIGSIFHKQGILGDCSWHWSLIINRPLTLSHLEYKNNLTLMKISSKQNNILKNNSLKIVIPLGFNNPSSNIFQNVPDLKSYVRSCQTVCALKI